MSAPNDVGGFVSSIRSSGQTGGMTPPLGSPYPGSFEISVHTADLKRNHGTTSPRSSCWWKSRNCVHAVMRSVNQIDQRLAVGPCSGIASSDAAACKWNAAASLYALVDECSGCARGAASIKIVRKPASAAVMRRARCWCTRSTRAAKISECNSFTYLIDHASSGSMTASGMRGVVFSPVARCCAARRRCRTERPRHGANEPPYPAGEARTGESRRLYRGVRRSGLARRAREVVKVGVEEGLVHAV